MDRTGNTVYIKTGQNVLVHKKDVFFSDIGSVECTDQALLAQIRAMKVYSFGCHGNVVVSVLKIIEQIHGIDPHITVVNEGETDFILEYRPKAVDDWVQTLKVILICVVIFFGTAFTIAAFHNDIGITDVFEQFYTQVTGREKPEVSVLEICYSLGLAVGNLVFFNHVGRKKLTHDLTPIQVQMRKYEKDVDAAFVEEVSREDQNIDVS